MYWSTPTLLEICIGLETTAIYQHSALRTGFRGALIEEVPEVRGGFRFDNIAARKKVPTSAVSSLFPDWVWLVTHEPSAN